MVYTQHLCAKCGSEHTQRNGTRQGHAKYQCKACCYQARFMPAAVAEAAHYALVGKLLVERNSQLSIMRATGVVRAAVAKLVKKARAASPPLSRLRQKKDQKRWEALELDEMWTFVSSKAHQVWRWFAVEHARRRIVAWVLGDRSAQTAQRLWEALPRRYRRHCWYFTDLWDACTNVLPWRHRPCLNGEGQTNIAEAINCSLRQRCGVLVRKSCSFSKSLTLHTASIKIVIDDYSLTLN